MLTCNTLGISQAIYDEFPFGQDSRCEMLEECYEIMNELVDLGYEVSIEPQRFKSCLQIKWYKKEK